MLRLYGCAIAGGWLPVAVATVTAVAAVTAVVHVGLLAVIVDDLALLVDDGLAVEAHLLQKLAVCGGLKNLREDTLQPLFKTKRDIYLWPDKDGVEEWRKLLDKFGYNRMLLYTDFLNQNWREEDGPKADAADIIVRKMH